MFTATLVAAILLRRSQRGLPLTATERLSIGLSGFIGAVVFAKLPFLVFSSGLGSPAAADAWMASWLNDGKTVLWGLAGGYLGVEIGKWLSGVKTRTGDSYVIPVAIAIAIGRCGCLLFGCCHGTVTDLPWGIRFPLASDGGLLARHPTQIYEIIFHLTAATLAWWGMQRQIFRGQWMLIYLLAYCGYRFATEFIRPELPIAGGLTFYQWSSVVLGAVYSMILIGRHRKSQRPVKSNREAM